jgi:putative transposase
LSIPNAIKRKLIEPECDGISISRQCQLLGLARSSYYWKEASDSVDNLHLMKLIDEEYTCHPFMGSRKMALWLNEQGFLVNRKRVQGLMRRMGIAAIYPKPNLSKASKRHKVYPYLLRGVSILRPNHVWSTDITYIRMNAGFIYLTAVIDWYSRYVLSWRLSNSLETEFCLEALEEALSIGCPEIFNTDQGTQFTCEKFTTALIGREIAISMDGKGRALDNVFVERLWRSVKYEEVYIKNYENVSDAYCNLEKYFTYYNTQRLHQALGYKRPIEVYKI